MQEGASVVPGADYVVDDLVNDVGRLTGSGGLLTSLVGSAVALQHREPAAGGRVVEDALQGKGSTGEPREGPRHSGLAVGIPDRRVTASTGLHRRIGGVRVPLSGTLRDRYAGKS